MMWRHPGNPRGFRAVEQRGEPPGVPCGEAKKQAKGPLAEEIEGGR